VKLDAVATAAGVGKGTVYIYFKSKEELYYSLIYDGFAGVVRRIADELPGRTTSAREQLRIVVRHIVDFSIESPQLFEAMRVAGIPDANSQWEGKRQEMSRLIEAVLRQGVEQGELIDARPDLTALYFTAMVRAVMLYGPKAIAANVLTDHILSVILGGIGKGQEPCAVGS
jgi:AcrR family transcriptional regulator